MGSPAAIVNSVGRLHVDSVYGAGSIVAPGTISSNNSSTSTLLANGSFVGVWEEVKDYSIIYTSVRSDTDAENSISHGLNLEFSQDGTSVDVKEDYSITSGTAGAIYSTQPSAKFFRVNYINGAIPQGLFRLQTLYRPNYGKPSSHRIDDPINDQNDAELVKAVLTAKESSTGTYVNIQATDSDNLRVTDAENGLAIAKGDVVGTTFIHKFGKAPDFDTTDGYVTVWDGAAGGGLDAMQYTYSTIADIDSLSSDEVTDVQSVELQGLDGNYNLVVQNATLNGQNRVALGSSLLRVFRMKNTGSSDFIGHINCYVSGTLTAGAPDDSSLVRAHINDGNNQTLMALYTIPAGKTGYMRTGFVSTAGARRDAIHNVRLIARPFGGVFQLKHDTSISAKGTSYIQHFYIEPEVIPEKTDVEVKCNTDENIAGVSAGFDMVLVDN